MRWTSLFLLLFAAAILFACGGDEYGDATSGGGTPEGGGDAAKKASETAPKMADVPRASPMAAKLAQERKMCDAVRDDAAKAKKARERAEYYATQTISGDALFYYGELWRMANDYAKAVENYQKFMRECPTDRNYWTAQYYTAVNLCKDGRPAEAIPQVIAFESKFPEKKKYLKSMASTVGYALLAQGDFDGASQMLGKAAELGDNYAGEEMVRCLWAKGEYDAARTKAADLKAQFEGGPEQKRYDSVADLASRMGKPAAKLDEVEGWSREFDPSSLSGKPYLVYFWSVRNRGTANKNERLLTKLYDRYNGEGLEIIGLSKHSGYNLETGETDEAMGAEEEIHNLKVWVYNFKTPWILGVVGDDKLFDYFGYRGNVPAIAVVGKKGNLRYFRDSSDEQGYDIIAKVVEKLLDE